MIEKVENGKDMQIDEDRILQNKLVRLKENIASLGSIAIAFSGGVDSTFLMAVARQVLNTKLVAVTVQSDVFPAREFNNSIDLAKKLGVDQVFITSESLDIPGFSKNPFDRCYLCKSNLFRKIQNLAKERGLDHIAEGTNQDDMADYRPGMRALKELGIESPLLEVGLRKNEIRWLSKQMGLETWNKQNAACLASRFAYGDKINKVKLKMVEMAEDFLFDYGLKQVRVRVHGDLARIEVGKDELHNLTAIPVMDDVSKYFKELGFRYVALDMQGYQMGSMNSTILTPDQTTDERGG